jgi:phosphomannomutase
MASLVSQLQYTPRELNFGTSGLRALVSDMTDLECYINTRGFINFMRAEQQLETGTVIYLAGDLRESTPRITASVMAAIRDAGFTIHYCGLIPTPALAYYALQHAAPGIMVTGSHIPADRNGIKFYKLGGEVLKEDEAAIKTAVATIRQQLYDQAADVSAFDTNGMLRQPPQVPSKYDIDSDPAETYITRYRLAFPSSALAGKKIVLYQHSAVGRDMYVTLLKNLGAKVITVGRSDTFVPIDTENITEEDRAYFKQLATEYSDAFAIVSTDGDSDRPFVIDERGVFHRGDELGAIVAEWLKADFAAYPISSSDAVDQFLTLLGTPFTHTKIGSPYVIQAMRQAHTARVVGWEVNGGFLLGTAITTTEGTLEPLPTRDAALPIIVALVAASQAGASISKLFSALPERYTGAGLLDNFPIETSKKLLVAFGEDTDKVREKLAKYFTAALGFAAIKEIDTMDGIRIYFENGDIAHIRPSGNAPQLRVYSVASTQERADDIIKKCLSQPSGILPLLASTFS